MVRQGRVKSIEQNRIVLDDGPIATVPNVLHVDCTADGLANRPVKPVFDGSNITLQSVRTCQQVFSAALISFVETNYDSDETKNEICVPVPHPNTDIDYLRTLLGDLVNGARWAQESALQGWLKQARLDFSTRSETSVESDMQRAEIVGESAAKAAEKLQTLLAQHAG